MCLTSIAYRVLDEHGDGVVCVVQGCEVHVETVEGIAIAHQDHGLLRRGGGGGGGGREDIA